MGSSCHPEPNKAMSLHSLVIPEPHPKDFLGTSGTLLNLGPLAMATLGTPMITINEFIHTFIQLQQELQQLRARVILQDNVESSLGVVVVARESREQKNIDTPPSLYTMFA